MGDGMQRAGSLQMLSKRRGMHAVQLLAGCFKSHLCFSRLSWRQGSTRRGGCSSEPRRPRRPRRRHRRLGPQEPLCMTLARRHMQDMPSPTDSPPLRLTRPIPTAPRLLGTLTSLSTRHCFFRPVYKAPANNSRPRQDLTIPRASQCDTLGVGMAASSHCSYALR